MTLFEADVLFAVEAGPKILGGATAILADEMAKMIHPREMQFASSSPTGEPDLFVLPVKPLDSEKTVPHKKRLEVPYPEVPRYRWGFMKRELEASGKRAPFATSANVGVSKSEKHEYQQTTRPFIGVTKEAMTRIEAMLPGMVQRQMDSFFSGKTIQVEAGITLSI